MKSTGATGDPSPKAEAPTPNAPQQQSLPGRAEHLAAHCSSQMGGFQFMGVFNPFLPQRLLFTSHTACFPLARLPHGFVFINHEARGAHVSQRPWGFNELSLV